MTRDGSQSPPQQHSPATNDHLPDSQTVNFTEILDQPEKSHLSNTLTLEPQIPPESISPSAASLLKQDPEKVEPDMSLASPIRSVGADSHAVANIVSKATSSRRGQKRKRVNRKQLEAIQQRVEILMVNLKLFPFVPNRTLGFAEHEGLLKHLGLWDFVHVEFDNSNLRVDLIAQLVVNYKRHGRVSEVNGVRIKVSRADLGRALKLPPVKKDSSGVFMVTDDDAGFVSEKSIKFIEDLMSDWMLLHDEDTWILPDEVMNWIELIRKGHPDRVEWASLMWFMVEKELSQGVQLVDCYYASHLQHLIKHQNERLFQGKPDVDVNLREEDEEEDGGDLEMVDEVEEHVAPAVSEDHVEDKMAFSLSNVHQAVSKDRVDGEMAFTLSSEHEAVSEAHMDLQMAFTLSSEHEAASKGQMDGEMTFTHSNEHEAASKGHMDDEMTFTHSNEHEAVCKGQMGEKTALTLSNEHEAASKDHIDEKMDFTLCNEHEAVSKDHIDEKIDCKLGNEHDAVIKDHIDEKMDFTLSNEHEAEEMGIDVNKVCSDDKISEEFMCVKESDANDDTQMKQFSLQIETNKSDVLQVMQNRCPEVKSEEPSIELTLGKDNIEQDGIGKDISQSESVMNLDDLGLGETGNWQLDESNAEGEPFLQPCSFGGEKDSFDVVGRVEDVTEEDEVDDDEEEEEVDEEEEMDDDDYDNDEAGEDERIDSSAKFDSLQGISSAHLFQGVDISQGAFGSPLPHINESHLQHFASHAETSSTALGNTLKRTTSHEQQLSHRTMIDEHKRFNSDAWNHQEPSDFYRCMENIEHWMGKAKMMYAAKEQECNQVVMNQQLLYGEVEQRNHMIEHQEKVTNEVRQKSQMEIYKLERELSVMVDLLDSYRKALKETRREFSEYRERHSLREEPIYKDAGPGGVVLSVAELERKRIKQEEEDKMKRVELESTIKSFEVKWYHEFEGHYSDVQRLDEKLVLLEESVKFLKSLPQKIKAEEIPEQPAKTEEIPTAKTEEIPEQPAKTED